MTATPLRNSLAAWRGDAPWPEWTRRRRVTVALLVGPPVLVGAFAWVVGFWVSWCTLFGGECTPEENRQLAVAGAVYVGSWVALVAATVVVFVLRRRFGWLVPALLPAWALVSHLIP